MDQEKRQHRQLKRTLKKAGTRKARRALKDDLVRAPEDAAFSEIDYGRDTSAPLNGVDKDMTRRRNAPPEE